MISMTRRETGLRDRSVALIFVVILTIGGSLSAQTPAQVQVEKEPVLVVSLSSLDGFLGDVNHLTTVAGMPQAGAMLNIYVGAFSQGIDRSQPLGVMVRMIDGVPAPMLFVAVADVKAMLKRLEPQFGPSDELDDGTLVMQAGQRLIFIRSQGAWAYVSNDRDSLVDLPLDPKALLHGLHLDHDIGIRANIQQIPGQLRLGLASQMRQAFEDAVKRIQENQQGEGIQAEAPNLDMVEQMESMLRDSEYVTIGISIDSENNEMAFDLSFTAVEGSKLATTYNGRKSVASQFTGFLSPDATFYSHAASTIGEQERQRSLESVNAVIDQLRAMYSQSGNGSDEIDEKIEAYMPRIQSLVEDSIKMGKIDGGLVVRSDGNQLRMLLGSAVADGRKIETLLKDAIKELGDAPNVPKIKFDDGTLGDLTLHRGVVAIPGGNEELKKSFGAEIPLVIATGTDSIYVGAGAGAEELLKATVAASRDAAVHEYPLAQGTLSLLPALQYAYWVSENSITDLLLKTIRSNPENDKVRFTQLLEPNGQRVRFSLDDGVLQVIGAATQTGNARPQF